MAKLKVPSVQHLARNWKETPEQVHKKLVTLARHPPQFSYEPLFNQPQTIKDAFGNVTTLSYDGKGNPIQVLSPLQRALRMGYNEQGLPIVMTDTLGTVANFTYNARGHLTQLNWGSGVVARTAIFTYTDPGYLQSMSDPLQRSFAYVYDNVGRLTSETLPGNRSVT